MPCVINIPVNTLLSPEESDSVGVIDVISRTKFVNPNNNNNNNNKHDNVYGAVIMAEPLREFTRFI